MSGRDVLMKLMLMKMRALQPASDSPAQWYFCHHYICFFYSPVTVIMNETNAEAHSLRPTDAACTHCDIYVEHGLSILQKVG